MKYTVQAEKKDGTKAVKKFKTYGDARDWVYDVAWEDDTIYHCTITTNNGHELVALIPCD
jgi:hypothetical protein